MKAITGIDRKIVDTQKGEEIREHSKKISDDNTARRIAYE